jgi:hypothetical protein
VALDRLGCDFDGDLGGRSWSRFVLLDQGTLVQICYYGCWQTYDIVDVSLTHTHRVSVSVQRFVVPYLSGQSEEAKRRAEEERAEKLKKEINDSVQSQTKELKDMLQSLITKQQEQQQQQQQPLLSSPTNARSTDIERDLKIQEMQAQLSKLRTMMLDQQQFSASARPPTATPSSTTTATNFANAGSLPSNTAASLPSWQIDPNQSPYSYKRPSAAAPANTTTATSAPNSPASSLSSSVTQAAADSK